MDHARWSSLLSDWDGGTGPRYARLAAALRRCIHDGQLAPGELLPAERRLAQLLHLSRSTVVAAYEDLAADGWLTRKQGSGTRVHASLPRQAEVLALRSPVPSGLGTPGELDLTIAVPDLSGAQRERLRRASAEAFAETVYHPLGLPQLRACLAEMYSREGLPTTPEQVIVTTGAQQAISLVTSTLLRPADAALLETPTFFGAIDVFRAAGASLLGVSVTPEGVRPQDFQAQLSARPRLAFLTPTYQNPTGTVMPAGTRERLAGLIAQARLPTIEDDTLIDLSFEGSVPPRLATYAPQAPIICVGSLSKLFWAGLRVGWLRVPRALAAPLVQAKTISDFGSATPSQAIALQLLRELPTLRAERRETVTPARDLLVALLREQLPDWAFQVPSGGQFLWVELPTLNATGFTHVARRYGVRLFPGASMSVTSLPDSFVRLPFTLPAEFLPEAVGRLRRAWEVFRERPEHELLA